MKTKKCNECNKIKPISAFPKHRGYKYGVRNPCKKCNRKHNKIYYEKNAEELRQKKRSYRKEHPEKEKAIRQRYAMNNRDKINNRQRMWKQNNPEKVKETNKKWKDKNPNWKKNWYKKNPIKAKKIFAKQHQKIMNNPKLRLSKAMRCLVYKALGKNKNGYKWESLVNYTLEDLRDHLEKQFKPGMSWSNYGKWHIDHIKPVSSFNFKTYNDREFKQCWALCNLQPLWAEENIRKSNKVIR